MSPLTNAPRLLKAGLVLIEPQSARIQRTIALQYNPDKLSRTLQPSTAGGESGDHSEAMRFKGPAVETIRLEADIDATDQLEAPERNPAAVAFGIHPQLALLESLANPTTAQLRAVDRQLSSGTLEITPMEAPLMLFVWSRSRIVPVRLSEFSITEEAFDPWLNPILAKVNLSLRVLSVDDLGFAHRGGGLFLSYLSGREQLAARVGAGSVGSLGIGGLP